MLGDWSFEIGFVVLEKVNMKKLILLSGSPCVGKTTVGQYLCVIYVKSADYERARAAIQSVL